MRKGYVGWNLPEEERARLLARFPAAYPRTVAHHATAAFNVSTNHPLPKETTGTVVGIADDGAGVQALVLSIGGTTARPDGSTWHVTWSLAPDRRPVESNDVIRSRGWTDVEPISVRLEPRFFPF